MCAPMRRLVAILVLFTVPLQLASAACEVHCELEKLASTVSHCDHHKSPADDTKSPASPKSGVHGCGLCHLAFSQVPSLFELAVADLAFAPPALEEHVPSGIPPTVLDRPPRPAL